ncbi:hypothetical protein [Bradyrhizobium sp. CCGUVB1N3]|uniref:hypothetical protein n=1 Tax=Bradyrhizobium sp. CCGUVB1N3 TaxID=2949629 RepID=UPI003531ED5E
MLVDTLGLLLSVVVHPAISKRATVVVTCSAAHAARSLSLSAFLPMLATGEPRWQRWSPTSVAGPLRSSSATNCINSSCRNGRCLHPSRHDPHHAQALDQASPSIMNPFLLDRL